MTPHSITNITMLGTDHFIFGGWAVGGIFPQAQSFFSEEVRAWKCFRASCISEYFFLFWFSIHRPWLNYFFPARLRALLCRGSHIWYQITTIWTTMHLLVVPMLYTKFQLNPTSGSGEEVENRFSRWLPWQPYWISYCHDLANRASTGCPDAPYQISAQYDKLVVEKTSKIDFKDCCHWRPYWISYRHNLYNLSSTSCHNAPHQISASIW